MHFNIRHVDEEIPVYERLLWEEALEALGQMAKDGCSALDVTIERVQPMTVAQFIDFVDG